MLCSGTCRPRCRSRCHRSDSCLLPPAVRHITNSSAGTRSTPSNQSKFMKPKSTISSPEQIQVPVQMWKISPNQQPSTALGQAHVSVRLRAAQPHMLFRSPGPGHPSDYCVGLLITHRACSHQDRGFTEAPSLFFFFLLLSLQSARCEAAQRGAARLPCVTANTGGSRAHHTRVM